MLETLRLILPILEMILMTELWIKQPLPKTAKLFVKTVENANFGPGDGDLLKTIAG